MARVFISFQQLSTPATKRDRQLQYTRPAFISWKFESRFSKLWILLATSDTRAAYPVDTVHHEMDSAVRSYRVYKSVYIVASNSKTTYPRE